MPLPANPYARYRASELVLSDTDPVSTWPDEGSGSFGDLGQATGASQPTYEAAGFNGHPSVLFDGVNDWMQVPSSPPNLPQPTTMVIMGEYVTVANDNVSRYVFDSARGTARNALFHNAALVGGAWAMIADANTAVADSPVGKEGVDLCLVALFNGASSEFHLNDGGDLMSGNPGTESQGGLTVAGRFNGHPVGSGGSNIRLVEVLVYDRGLTSGEISDLQDYFNDTYGLAAAVEVDVAHGLVLGHGAEFEVVAAVEVEARHGLVLGHQAQVDLQVSVDVAHGLVLGHSAQVDLAVVGQVRHGLVLGHRVAAAITEDLTGTVRHGLVLGHQVVFEVEGAAPVGRPIQPLADLRPVQPGAGLRPIQPTFTTA